MRTIRSFLAVLLLSIFLCTPVHSGNESASSAISKTTEDLEKEKKQTDTMSMLIVLVKLQEEIAQHKKITQKQIKGSDSDTEIASLKSELERLDRQHAESADDFERIATNVDVVLFAEKKPETFSWQEEFTDLARPAIKELKRLTIRTRNKTKLKDTISEFKKLVPVSHEAVQHLNNLKSTTKNQKVAKKLKELLPEWQNIEQRILNKLEVTELELVRLEEQDTGLTESLTTSTRIFFRDRGKYLLGAIAVFFLVLLLSRFTYRLFFSLLPEETRKELPFYIRLMDFLVRSFTVVLAALCSFMVLYRAEDWFLLSMAIIALFALSWAMRQGLSKMWQQARLMMNIGSVREGERLTINGIPWKVERINVFCKLYNPALDLRIRLPIENVVGQVSRVFKPEEPWFPCKKGDWVVVGDRPRSRVISLSHETVELVERGGKRIFYQTQDFIGASPVNLSLNFRIRVPFGISYNLQSIATTTIPEIMQEYIKKKLDEKGYGKGCLHLSVEFMQAGGSSLDLIILADFKGSMADISTRIERYIQSCCVEVCTTNNWEIPFPQLTFHWPEKEKFMRNEIDQEIF